jgi:sec-independent protein translocase protein TatC
VFFFIGMSFAYFFVFPEMFSFFAGYTPDGVQMMTDIDKYLSFVLAMFLAFGLTFEVPVVVIVLVRLRVVSLEKLRSIRCSTRPSSARSSRRAGWSQLMLAVPLWLLYELGSFLALRACRNGRGRAANVRCEVGAASRLRIARASPASGGGCLPTSTSTRRLARRARDAHLRDRPGR